jgi:hypothetical protein
VLGISHTGRGAARRYFVDTTQIVFAQCNVQSSGIFFEVFSPLCPWDWNNVLALGKQPSERELTGRAFLFFGNGLDAANEIKVFRKIFSQKAR